MIALLKGLLSHKSPDSLIVDVNGVGYEVAVSQITFRNLPDVGSPIEFIIHTHVTETSLALYAFANHAERQLFRKLMSVSGVGPKLALAILSGLPVNEIIESIVGGNSIKLTGISGVGKKTAERLVMELKDKLIELNGSPLSTSMNKSGPRQGHAVEETLSALINLGYNNNQAEKTLAEINVDPSASFETVFKAALALLSKN